MKTSRLHSSTFLAQSNFLKEKGFSTSFTVICTDILESYLVPNADIYRVMKALFNTLEKVGKEKNVMNNPIQNEGAKTLTGSLKETKSPISENTEKNGQYLEPLQPPGTPLVCIINVEKFVRQGYTDLAKTRISKSGRETVSAFIIDKKQNIIIKSSEEYIIKALTDMGIQVYRRKRVSNVGYTLSILEDCVVTAV